MDSFEEVWKAVIESCKNDISEVAYDLWITPLEKKSFDGDTLRIYVKNEFTKGVFEKNYAPLIKQKFSELVGFEVKVVILEESVSHPPIKNDYTPNSDESNNDDIDFFTFDTFVVGPSNKFAFAAAKAVAADPGGQINKSKNSLTNYNPLFIYGNSGLGKTHLLNAISYSVRTNYPDMNVVYVSAEKFVNEFVSSISNKTIEEFHKKYRSDIDLFLVDDIQFIAGKTQTEEEFFHTFNELVNSGKQIVLTSDRPPKEIQSLTERIKSRFESGLLADISFPEYETRCAIIKRKAQQLDFKINDRIVTYIAEKIKTNIRQLEGITKKLHALCYFENIEPNITLAQKAIKDVMNDVQPIPITIERIIEEVSRTTGISKEKIYSTDRTANISNARQIAIYVIREVTGLSYNDIAEEFKRDHATIMYSYDKTSEKINKDQTLKSQIQDIISNVKSEK